MKRRGTTLAEMIVASGVLCIMVAMTSTAVVSYSSAYRQYTEKGLRVRQAAKVLEVVTQHLRSADSVPQLDEPLSCAKDPLVFSERGAGPRAIFLDAHGVLELQELDADRKVKSFFSLGKAQGLTVEETRQGSQRSLHLKLSVEGSTPLETSLSLRGVAQ